MPAATKNSTAHAPNTKEATLKGIPPKNPRWRSHFAPFCATLVFGGEGRRPVLHIDKGNAT
eukprot:4424632-Ditylum_brightwellii.AAC.1